jgi:effector-binding domain-containing protein
MNICTRPSMTVLFQTRQATLPELGNFAGTVVKELYTYVVDLDLLVCGPQYWFYYGIDGRPMAAGGGLPTFGNNRFTVEIAIPVQGQIPTALLPFFKQVPAFKCLSHRHLGPWQGLSGAYGQMIEHINANKLNMNGIYSESFLHVDFVNPENNITEIQIGLL